MKHIDIGLRLPARLHHRLRQMAKREQWSVNETIIQCVEEALRDRNLAIELEQAIGVNKIHHQLDYINRHVNEIQSEVRSLGRNIMRYARDQADRAET